MIPSCGKARSSLRKIIRRTVPDSPLYLLIVKELHPVCQYQRHMAWEKGCFLDNNRSYTSCLGLFKWGKTMGFLGRFFCYQNQQTWLNTGFCVQHCWALVRKETPFTCNSAAFLKCSWDVQGKESMSSLPFPLKTNKQTKLLISLRVGFSLAAASGDFSAAQVSGPCLPSTGPREPRLQGLWLTGSAAPWHVESLRLGTKSMFPELASGFVTTGPPGRSSLLMSTFSAFFCNPLLSSTSLQVISKNLRLTKVVISVCLVASVLISPGFCLFTLRTCLDKKAATDPWTPGGLLSITALRICSSSSCAMGRELYLTQVFLKCVEPPLRRLSNCVSALIRYFLDLI